MMMRKATQHELDFQTGEGVMGWYIAATSALLPACVTLTRMGCEVEYPRRRLWKIVRNKKVEIEERLLNELILVRGEVPHRILQAIGVYKLLKNADGDYATVTDSELSDMDHEENKKPRLVYIAEGKQVEVRDGIYKGYCPFVAYTEARKRRKGKIMVRFPQYDNRTVELYARDVRVI